MTKKQREIVEQARKYGKFNMPTLLTIIDDVDRQRLEAEARLDQHKWLCWDEDRDGPYQGDYWSRENWKLADWIADRAKREAKDEIKS